MHRLAAAPGTAGTTGMTLCHLLPALSWGEPRRLGAVLDHPRLPPRWWSGSTLNDVTATVGADEVARRAAAVLRADWSHLTLDDAMPALRFCAEGQRTDRRRTIAWAAGGKGALEALVQAVLRPFLEGGRDLARAAAGAPGEPRVQEPELHDLAAALVRRLPDSAPADIRAAARSVAAWAAQPALPEAPAAAVPKPADGRSHQDMARTRCCFQNERGMWSYRVQITREHLRGAGFPVPTAFAAYLGLTAGGRTALAYDTGAVAVSWEDQPRFGSLRPLLAEQRFAEGDQVFLLVRDGRVQVRPLIKESAAGPSGVCRALRLMGLYRDYPAKQLPDVIGRRIGLTGARSMDEVYAHLRLRGDQDILALLLEDTAADAPLGGQRPEDAAAGAQPPRPRTEQAPLRRDPAWDADVIPYLDPDDEADLLALAKAVAARGKRAPVVGYELGDAGWLAGFAWQHGDVRIAAFAGAEGADAEAAAAFRAEGWRTGSATQWLQQLDALAAALPDVSVPRPAVPLSTAGVPHRTVDPPRLEGPTR